MSGWIKLYRNIQSHWLWKSEKPFDKRSAWIDILLLANHDANKVFFDNEIVFVERGEHITSEPKLAERWGWSRTKVRNFLKLLEQEQMIENKKEGKKRTRLIVLNYNDYQGSENNERTRREQGENNERTRREQGENINKNDKNDKNDKEVYKDIVEYLNKKASKNFRHSTKATQYKINARLEEGFALDDFKKVIDIKCSQWLGTDMEKYLRPETLFGTKFESYLNENIQKQQNQQYKNKQYNKPKKTRFHNFEQRTDKYSADDLEAIARRKREKFIEKMKA